MIAKEAWYREAVLDERLRRMVEDIRRSPSPEKVQALAREFERLGQRAGWDVVFVLGPQLLKLFPGHLLPIVAVTAHAFVRDQHTESYWGAFGSGNFYKKDVGYFLFGGRLPHEKDGTMQEVLYWDEDLEIDPVDGEFCYMSDAEELDYSDYEYIGAVHVEDDEDGFEAVDRYIEEEGPLEKKEFLYAEPEDGAGFEAAAGFSAETETFMPWAWEWASAGRTAFLGLQDGQGTEEDFMTLKVPGKFPTDEQFHPEMEEKDDEEKPRKHSDLKNYDSGGEESQPRIEDLSNRQLARLGELARSNPKLFEQISQQHAVIDVDGIPVSPSIADHVYRFIQDPERYR